MSGVPIQLSGDTLYMSSTLIKFMPFILCHPISLYGGVGTLCHMDSQFLYTGMNNVGMELMRYKETLDCRPTMKLNVVSKVNCIKLYQIICVTCTEEA